MIANFQLPIADLKIGNRQLESEIDYEFRNDPATI